MTRLTDLIVSADGAVRNQSLADACAGRDRAALLAERDALERFRRDDQSLYHRVRALFFLYALHRFHLPARPARADAEKIPYPAVELLLARRFDEAVRAFRAAEGPDGPGEALCSGLAAAYHGLAFQKSPGTVGCSGPGPRPTTPSESGASW
jgi:hypothetical protein